MTVEMGMSLLSGTSMSAVHAASDADVLSERLREGLTLVPSRERGRIMDGRPRKFLFPMLSRRRTAVLHIDRGARRL